MGADRMGGEGKAKGAEQVLRGMFCLGILRFTKLPIATRMSTTPFLVHRASPSDLDTVSSLFDAYRVFYEQSSDIASARRFMQERLTKQDSVVFLALNHDGKSLGFTQLYPLFSSVRMRSIWLLNDLFVDKDARRMGVAHALMEHARDFARASGVLALSWLQRRTTNRQSPSTMIWAGNWIRNSTTTASQYDTSTSLDLRSTPCFWPCLFLRAHPPIQRRGRVLHLPTSANWSEYRPRCRISTVSFELSG